MSKNKRKTKGTPDAVDVHVGKRLRVRRSLLGMSQEKLAEAIGLTFQQVQKYEHGMNRISAGRLYNFSKILEVPIAYFFENLRDGKSGARALGFSDQEQEGFLHADKADNKETLELIRVYYSIEDPQIRKDMIRMMKNIGGKL